MAIIRTLFVTAAIAACLAPAAAQPDPGLVRTPTPVTPAQFARLDGLDGRLVTTTAVVRRTGSAQVFTVGEQAGSMVHIVVPHPATDAANVGDTVVIAGFVRRFDSSAFERDYKWFRRADYPGLEGGSWVIVATSVRTSEGTDLVPPGTISDTAPAGKTP